MSMPTPPPTAPANPAPPAPAPSEPPAAPSPTPAAPAPAASPAPPAPNRPDGVSEAEWAALGDPGKVALVRERAAAKKAVDDLAALQRQVEDAKLTAEQKAAKDLKDAQEAAATATARALRYEVAAAKGIPLELAGRLTGTTQAEIEADAEIFKAQIPAGATPPPRTPTPDPSQGPQPTPPANEADAIYEALYGPQTRK